MLVDGKDCGVADFTGFNVTCLCNTRVENNLVRHKQYLCGAQSNEPSLTYQLTCVNCALGAEANPSQATNSYQSLLDGTFQSSPPLSGNHTDDTAYIGQCAYASVTLPSATVGVSTSVSGASSSSGSSGSSSSASASVTSSSMSGSASTSSPASASSQASSASSAAASATPSNTATRGMDRAWAWSLTGVAGVVIAAAVGL